MCQWNTRALNASLVEMSKWFQMYICICKYTKYVYVYIEINANVYLYDEAFMKASVYVMYVIHGVCNLSNVCKVCNVCSACNVCNVCSVCNACSVWNVCYVCNVWNACNVCNVCSVFNEILSVCLSGCMLARNATHCLMQMRNRIEFMIDEDDDDENHCYHPDHNTCYLFGV